MKIVKLILFITLPLTLTAQNFPKRKYYDADLLYRALNRYHTDSMQKVSAGGVRPAVNVTDAIKAKLWQLLKREWTPYEIKSKVDADYRENFERLYLDWILNTAKNIKLRENVVYDSVYKKVLAVQIANPNISKRVAENYSRDQAKKISLRYRVGFDSVYRSIYDSTAFVFRTIKEREIKEAPVPDEILLFISLAKMKDAVPYIKRELTSGYRPPFDVETAEIALAGMGETEYLDRVYKRHKEYVGRKTWVPEEMVRDATALGTVIETQESFAMLADWMDSTRTYQQVSELKDDPRAPKRYLSAGLVPNILSAIKNPDFAEGYQKVRPSTEPVNYYDDYNVTGQHIQYIKNWLLANKGKYEFW